MRGGNCKICGLPGAHREMYCLRYKQSGLLTNFKSSGINSKVQTNSGCIDSSSLSELYACSRKITRLIPLGGVYWFFHKHFPSQLEKRFQLIKL